MVDIIVVTYGDRWKFLKETLSVILEIEEMRRVIIIDNDSSYQISEKISHKKLIVQKQNGNTGSAKGFKSGIAFSLQNSDADFIWLLDDDNVPEKNTLNELLLYWKENITSTEKDALMALRRDRNYLLQVAHGKPVLYYFPQKNAFLGLHIFKIYRLIFKKLNTTINPQKRKQSVVIPCSPYGGLFFHKDLISKIGLPDERYFLYADDYEFTYRITNNSGKIFLIPSAAIKDADASWIHNPKYSLTNSKFFDRELQKSYFLVRNTIAFQKKYFVKNNIIFNINGFVYTLHLYLLAMFKNKMKHYGVFRKAVSDGRKNNFDNTNRFNSML